MKARTGVIEGNVLSTFKCASCYGDMVGNTCSCCGMHVKSMKQALIDGKVIEVSHNAKKNTSTAEITVNAELRSKDLGRWYDLGEVRTSIYRQTAQEPEEPSTEETSTEAEFSLDNLEEAAATDNSADRVGVIDAFTLAKIFNSGGDSISASNVKSIIIAGNTTELLSNFDVQFGFRGVAENNVCSRNNITCIANKENTSIILVGKGTKLKMISAPEFQRVAEDSGTCAFNNLETLEIRNVDTDECKELTQFISNAPKLCNLDISSLTFENLRRIDDLIRGTEIEVLDLSGMTGKHVTSIANVCYGCIDLKKIDMRNFSPERIIISTGKEQSTLFDNLPNLCYVNLASWNFKSLFNDKQHNLFGRTWPTVLDLRANRLEDKQTLLRLVQVLLYYNDRPLAKYKRNINGDIKYVSFDSAIKEIKGDRVPGELAFQFLQNVKTLLTLHPTVDDTGKIKKLMLRYRGKVVNAIDTQFMSKIHGMVDI